MEEPGIGNPIGRIVNNIILIPGQEKRVSIEIAGKGITEIYKWTKYNLLIY